MEKEDLTGQRFGMWTVLYHAGRKGNSTYWHCRCDCGNEKDLPKANLTRGLSTSCGCTRKNRHPSNFIDLTGERFGRLLVQEIAYKKGWEIYWKCKCDCGKTTNVLSAKLRNGKTKSCGCLRKEMLVKRNEKHGLRHKRIYNIYCTMKARCYSQHNSNYHNYGARGIIVCDEWMGEHGAENFIKWAYENGYDENAKFGECTLDRIDVNGNYEPSNCRWISVKEQANNTRLTIFLTYKGETKSASEWSEITGISKNTINGRKRKGWSDERCLETPVKGKNKNNK